MDLKDYEITFREVLVSIAITCILIGLGFLISEKIQNSVNESNEKYYKSLKINNDGEKFKYAIKTNLGYVLAQGKVQAVNGVHINDIDGTYFRIRKVKEQYTMHTRQVAHTRTKSDGTTETYYTTEEYWTWDYLGEEEFHTEKFKFLEVEFIYDTIHFSKERYKETINESSHVRYQYYIIPFEFEGTLFTYIDNNTINKNIFWVNKTIENIINEKENETNGWNTGFWVIWIIFTGFVDFGYIGLENKYLED